MLSEEMVKSKDTKTVECKGRGCQVRTEVLGEEIGGAE